VIKAAASALCLAMLVGGASAKPAPARTIRSDAISHCRTGERIVYTCQFGKKLGSVCLGQQSLHYRFGPKGRAELDLVSTPDWNNIHLGGNRSQGGLNQNYIRFTNGNTHYVIHAGETGPLNERPGRRLSGIVVLGGIAGETQIATLECKGGKQLSDDTFRDLTNAAPDAWDSQEPEGGPFDVIY
jgi:hypothetical protein